MPRRSRWIVSVCCALLVMGLTLRAVGGPALNDQWFQMFRDCSGSVCIEITDAGAATPIPAGSQPSIHDRWMASFADCSGSPCLRVTGGGGAPTTATYITQTPDASLSAEQALSLLGTGLMFNTTATGVVSIYAGTAPCTNNWLTSLNASGVGSCTSATLASAQFANQGTTTTLLHGNAAGNPSWGPAVLTTEVSGILPVGNGGTGSSSGVALNTIIAAIADQSGIANADWNTRWNWQKTTDSEVAFELGETAASTNGTSTAGVPNQVIAKFSTKAGSTASPASFYSRDTHVVSISPTTQQILADASGTYTKPVYGFAAKSSAGMHMIGDTTYIFDGGGGYLELRSGTGLIGYPIKASGASAGGDAHYLEIGTYTYSGVMAGYALSYHRGTGTYLPIVLDGSYAIIADSGLETVRFDTGLFQPSYASADAVSYAITCRKARGTVAAPTVITTGDSGCLWAADYYVGATNTYQRGSYLEQVSTGTISDSATGVGSIVNIYTAKVGAEPALALSVKDTKDVTMGLSAPATNAAEGFPQMPVMAGTPTGVPTALTGFSPYVYDSTGQKVWVYDFVAAAWKGAGGVGGGGASLDAITAAAADQSGILNADWNIVWKWAKVTDSEVAFNFTESAAATNGTSSSGVPNQVLLKLNTLAASTMSPLSVYSRGSHVMSVSPSAAQLLFTDGSASVPSIARATAPNSTGIHFAAKQLNISTTSLNAYIQTGFRNDINDSTTVLIVDGSGVDGPSVGLSSTTNGIWSSNIAFGVLFSSVEQIRWTSGVEQYSFATAAATSYAVNFRKSRGTVKVPTVITTGDDLATISGYGYVGATNTYQQAAYMLIDSAGTISDSATGIGGVVDLYTAIVGAEPALRLRVDNLGHLAYSGTAPSMGTCGTGPAVAGNDMAMLVTVGTAMGTSCAVNFAQTWVTNAPVCVAQSDTDIVGLKTSVSTTVVTVTATAAFTDSSKLQIVCAGRV